MGFSWAEPERALESGYAGSIFGMAREADPDGAGDFWERPGRSQLEGFAAGKETPKSVGRAGTAADGPESRHLSFAAVVQGERE
jgi:hypothetical protein